MSTTTRTRGRPRSSEAKQSILHAALQEFEEKGFNNLTIESIARTAGVSKPTLYRWWSSKAEVVLEALTQLTSVGIPVPNHGNLADDINSYLTDTCKVLNTNIGILISELIGVSQLDREFGERFWKEFLVKRREGLLTILRRAKGMMDEENESAFEFIADFCYGTIWYRLLNRNGLLDKQLVDDLVNMVLHHSASLREET